MRRKTTSRIHKKNRRKHFQRKIHRHSTRVLSLKPASILLPPYENDIQDRNVSTLNPFIINVLSSSSEKKFEFFPSLSDQEKNQSNKPYQNIISPRLERNSTNIKKSNIMTTTEYFKSPIIVPPSGPISSDPETQPTPASFQFSEVSNTPSTELTTTYTPPPPYLFLLPPYSEIENNIIDTQILENPNDLQLPRSSDYFETSTFSTNHQTTTETSTSLEVNKELNQTSYDNRIKTSDDLNNTSENQENNSHNFNNTLLAPDVASLGMKIVTSRKGLEMIKELVTSKEPPKKKQYDEPQSLLETAESGDIRLHTYNQILSIGKLLLSWN